VIQSFPEPVVALEGSTPPTSAGGRFRRGSGGWAGYLFISPSLFGVIAFLVIPVILVIVVSFFHWNLLGHPTFAGLSNYTQMFAHYHAVTSLYVTAYYVVLTIPVLLCASVLLALFLNRPLPAMGFFRVIFVLPYMAAPVAMGIVWTWIFDPRLGAVNELLHQVGLSGPTWLSSRALAMPVIALVSIWSSVGYNTLFFLAGLQAIPHELYESGMLDGASRLQLLRKVTLPLLRPTVLFVSITNVIGSFQVFDTVYVMTQGGPGTSTQVINIQIYDVAFQDFQLGLGSAMAMVLFVIILVFTILQFLYFRKRITYELA